MDTFSKTPFNICKDYSIGIDLGNYQSVAAIFSPEKSAIPTVVANRLANAATPSVVYYGAAPREIGEEAEGKLLKDPTNTITHLYSLAGATMEDMRRLHQRFIYTFRNNISDHKENFTWLSVMYKDQPVEVPIETILGFYLKEIYRLAISSFENGGGSVEYANTYISGTVVAIPSSVTEAQRKIIYRACKLANLKNVSLVSYADAVFKWWMHRIQPHIKEYLSVEYTSPSFNLGNGQRILSCTRSDINDGPFPSTSLHFAIVDIGYTQSTIQILCILPSESFSETPSVQRLAEKCDANLGTYDMISALTSHCITIWNSKGKQTVTEGSRQSLRLFYACSKAIKDLSGLKESTIDLEAFVEDEHFNYTVTRDIFECLCKQFKIQLEELIDSTLTTAMTQDTALNAWTDLFAIEIVGGGSRIPFVQKTLIIPHLSLHSTEPLTESVIEAYKKTLLRRSLDGNSSLAMGGATLVGVSPIETSSAPKISTAPSSTTDDASVAVTSTTASSDASNHVGDTANTEEVEEEAGLLKERKNLEDWFEEKDKIEIKYQEKYHDLEAFVLDIQRALKGPYNHLLQNSNVSQVLDVAEAWMRNIDGRNHPTIEECEDVFENVKQQIYTSNPAYFEAIEKEKQEKEKEIELAAQAEKKPEDMDVKLPNAQCLLRARRNKNEGNDLYNGGNVELAARHYLKALEYCGKMFDITPSQQEEINEIKLIVNSNLAQCYLSLNTEVTLKKAVACCSSVLSIDSKNVKGMYRKAIALERLKNYEEAAVAIKEALILSPDSKSLLSAQQRVAVALQTQKANEKKMYGRMFQ